MDYDIFNSYTGTTLSEADQERFETVAASATKQLERLLGYPLDPADWANLYNETGKTQDDCICPDVDNDLDAPDAVVGKYRLFNYHPTDRYLAIDPATAIHKVKLIRENITYKTFDLEDGEANDDIAIKWENGNPKITKYLDLESCRSWYGWYESCWRQTKWVQLAVDATWAYTTVPEELLQALAGMIGDGYDERSDIQSESRGSHSYTKFDRQGWVEKYPALADFAGPNGTARIRVL